MLEYLERTGRLTAPIGDLEISSELSDRLQKLSIRSIGDIIDHSFILQFDTDLVRLNTFHVLSEKLERFGVPKFLLNGIGEDLADLEF